MRSEYLVQSQSSLAVQQRLEWFKEYLALGNAKETCAHFGISRKTFYKWYKRFRSSGGNPSSLADLPRTPHHFPRRTTDEIRHQVIELRNATGFGPRRLSKELQTQKGVKISERTIWKIIRSTPPLFKNATTVQVETVQTRGQVAVES